MRAQLQVVTDYDDTPDSEPTKPGDFRTPGHVTAGHVVHRLVCPHHHIPWLKVVAVQVLIAAIFTLVACGFR